MQSPTLLKGRSQRPVEPLLEVEDAAPLDDMGKQVSVEGRVVGQQLRQVEGALGGHEVLQAHLARRDVGPIAGRHQPMVGVGPVLAYPLEDHGRQSRWWPGCGLRYAARHLAFVARGYV